MINPSTSDYLKAYHLLGNLCISMSPEGEARGAHPRERRASLWEGFPSLSLWERARVRERGIMRSLTRALRRPASPKADKGRYWAMSQALAW
jgi:hypothetical protein